MGGGDERGGDRGEGGEVEMGGGDERGGDRERGERGRNGRG